MTKPPSYLMESFEESVRLELKTDPDAVRKHAKWCGLKPGLRVLDLGCGPGKTSSILYEMIQPGGELLGVDFSETRIAHAKEHYGERPGIDFKVCDFTRPMDELGHFDIIWVRFVLEYYRVEAPAIIKNITNCLKPEGYLCLMDLDYNCLNHYEISAEMEQALSDLMRMLEDRHNFDPYAGRKLYSFLYDLGYEDIRLDLTAHHLIYGNVTDVDAFNWMKKMQTASVKSLEVFERYKGGIEGFFEDFARFFYDPRRFTYTPLILCKGRKPSSLSGIGEK